MSAAAITRLDELARDAGRELALQPDQARTELFSRFVQTIADEVAAALEHHRGQQAAA